jgi:putative hydrolase of the HAD superfamily
MHQASIEHLESVYKFWDLFTGKVISCRIHLIKPEAAIYRHLLQEYALTAEETIFIDDMAVNLEAANQFGIRTIKFESPEQCEDRLRELNLL